VFSLRYILKYHLHFGFKGLTAFDDLTHWVIVKNGTADRIWKHFAQWEGRRQVQMEEDWKFSVKLNSLESGSKEST
jgi:hypothetical protein